MKTLLALVLVLISLNANSQGWPAKPIRYIVPFPPGAFNDTLARTISAELSKTLGQPMVVDNRPGGNSIIGTSVHLSMELFKSMTKTFMVHIPYKGSAPVVTDLLAGQVDVMFDNVPNVIGHVRAGKMKALAVSTGKRSALAPEVPTVAEAGVPGYELSVWFGVLAPAGTPHDIIQRLNAEIVKVLNSPGVRERFAKQGVEVQTSTPEHFDGFVKSEVARWAKVIKDAGIKAD